MRSLPFEIGFVLLALTFGCAGASRDERKELVDIERALGQITNAHAEDRYMLLGELGKVAVTQPRTVAIKDLCFVAYREFDKTARLLEISKAQMATAERAVADAKARQNSGAELSADQAQTLISTSSAAGVALQQLNRSLELAERSIADCKQRREALRTELIGQ